MITTVISHRVAFNTGHPLHSTCYIRSSVTQTFLNLVSSQTVVFTSGHLSGIGDYILSGVFTAGHFSHVFF